MGLEFDKAADQFKTVLDLNRDFTGEADKEWHVVQKIQRAAPGTKIGKQIAIIEKIGRADAAALFIQELNIDRLFEKRGKTFDPSFKSPAKEEFKADKIVAMEPATDIATHPLKADIDTVIQLGVRGLEPSPDHKFEPAKPLLKAEYAIMLEDIMIRITGDTKLATQFFGQKSPYPDIRPDMYYFNAAMLLGSRGILEADKVTGEFGGGQAVSGADALLAIRMFKEALDDDNDDSNVAESGPGKMDAVPDGRRAGGPVRGRPAGGCAGPGCQTGTLDRAGGDRHGQLDVRLGQGDGDRRAASDRRVGREGHGPAGGLLRGGPEPARGGEGRAD
jgi:hypothetical protein